MVKADIYNDKGKHIGSLVFSRNNTPILTDSKSKKLEDFINSSIKNGIKQRKDLVDGTKRVVYQVSIEKDKSNYPLAFLEWLRRYGYKVELLRPEVDEEIEKLLGEIPKDHPIRRKIVEDLPNMTYLEKTFILEVLRKSINNQR